jgi:isopentenyldiphosphate isomerase
MSEPAEEIAVVVDERDHVIGRALRSEARAHNLLHRGIAVLCRNSDGDIYVHRRTAIKDVFPSLYDMWIGGMVRDGESYTECARRELSEELGITGTKPSFMFKHLYRGAENRCWTAAFTILWDGPIVPQAEEIAWGSFTSPADLDARIEQWEFCPDALEVFRRYQRWLRSSQSSG